MYLKSNYTVGLFAVLMLAFALLACTLGAAPIQAPPVTQVIQVTQIVSVTEVLPAAQIPPTAQVPPTVQAPPTIVPELCGLLTGKSININANNFPGVIGPSGISAGGDGSFTTVAAFAKEQVDLVSGQCKANTLTFSRTRRNAFTQVYTGALAQNSTNEVNINGMFTDQNGKQYPWSGKAVGAVMPSDLCWRLASKSINIAVGNFKGVVGPSGIVLTDAGNGEYNISTEAVFPNEPKDPVSGKCSGNMLNFTRTRKNVFTQTYSGALAQNGGAVLMQGSLVDQNGGQASWSGQIIEPAN